VTDPSVPPPLNDPASIRGLIFDLDGTLIDSYLAIRAGVNHARSHYGLPEVDDRSVRRRVGRGLEQLIAELVGERRVERGVRLFRERYAEVFRSMTFALPGATATLRRLHRCGYRSAVASNKPARFGEPILESLEMLPFLEGVLGPDRVGSSKPDPAMIEACLHLLRLPRERVIYVGDMVLDVETAARAGLSVLLVGGGSSSLEELRATGQPVLERLELLLEALNPGNTA
jgi:phosphoglycolate phosphatase